jgi:ParB family chromosome partitioning protein
MSKKHGLGRGLGALIAADERALGRNEVVRMIPVESLQPNPHQPRSVMDEAQLAELAASIRAHGLIQPIIVTETAAGYVLIAGERRWRAAELAGLTEVPVIVKETTPEDMLVLALIENVQRADLNPLEEAHAYKQLVEEFGLTHADVADRVGKGRSTVSNLIRLLDLPENIQAAVFDGRISGAHARALLSLPTPEMQTNTMNRIIRLNLSVRQTEDLVAKLMAETRPTPRPRKSLSPELADLQTRFEESLGTRVTVQKGEQGGKVVIHFYSDEELDAIYQAIVGEEH